MSVGDQIADDKSTVNEDNLSIADLSKKSRESFLPDIETHIDNSVDNEISKPRKTNKNNILPTKIYFALSSLILAVVVLTIFGWQLIDNDSDSTIVVTEDENNVGNDETDTVAEETPILEDQASDEIRRFDANSLLAQIIEYKRDTGEYPNLSTIASNEFLNEYLDGEFTDPSDGQPYEITLVSTLVGTIGYSTAVECDDSGKFSSRTESVNNVAIQIVLKSGETYCVDNT